MSGRHARPAAARRRSAPLLMTAATLLGLWFGIRAPEISPVTPAVPAGQVQPVDDGLPTQTPPTPTPAGEG